MNGEQNAAKMLAGQNGQFDKVEPPKVQYVALALRNGDVTRPFRAIVVGPHYFATGMHL